MQERTIPDDEREELQEAALRGLERLGLSLEDVAPVVAALEAYAARPTAPGRDRSEEAFELGALLCACFELGLGFELVELTWDVGLTALAVVEMDRSLVILPFAAVDAALEGKSLGLATSYERLEAGQRPPGLARDGHAVLIP